MMVEVSWSIHEESRASANRRLHAKVYGASGPELPLDRAVAFVAYRGRVLIRLSKYEEALQSIEYAVRLVGPAVHNWHLWRGIAELELGRDQSAKDSFSRALAALPGNPYVQAAMAGFRALKGERELAAIHVGELRRLTPSMDNQMRLVEFNKGADNRPLPNRLGAGLRQALEEQPEAPQLQRRATSEFQRN